MVTSGNVPALPDGTYEDEALQALADHFLTAEPGVSFGSGSWWVDSLAVEGDAVTLRVVGQDAGRHTTRRLEVRFERAETQAVRPFETAVLGCNGINLQGSGTIDSYNSNDGPYNPGSAGSNATVSVLNGDLTLPGATRVMGDLHVGGSLSISGSAAVLGFIHAVNDVNFQGNPMCPANEVKAGGRVNTPGSWWCQASRPHFEEGANIPAPQGTCDPLNVNDFVDGRLADVRGSLGPGQSGNFSGWRAEPIVFDDDVHFNDRLSVGATNTVVFDSETVDQVFVDGDFTLGGSGSVHIKAPTTPGADGVVRIFVDGDMRFGGGADFVIEEGAAVEFYVTGEVDLGAGLDNRNSAPTIQTENGPAPTFAVYSSYEGANGVQIGGSSQIFASVYAPRTDVNVVGSGGLYGSVRGRSVNIYRLRRNPLRRGARRCFDRDGNRVRTLACDGMERGVGKGVRVFRVPSIPVAGDLAGLGGRGDGLDLADEDGARPVRVVTEGCVRGDGGPAGAFQHCRDLDGDARRGGECQGRVVRRGRIHQARLARTRRGRTEVELLLEVQVPQVGAHGGVVGNVLRASVPW